MKRKTLETYYDDTEGTLLCVKVTWDFLFVTNFIMSLKKNKGGIAFLPWDSNKGYC